MAPQEGLVHLKEYDWRDSNVELIGTDIDHQVKYKSAESEPAWNDGKVGQAAGLRIWRIEDFEVIPWPKDKYGKFYDGDSYIVLHSYKVGDKDGQEKLGHDIFFWLGSKTSQDEAGTAAYKTVELDEFLHGVASQHRELQHEPSEAFVALFPRITILSGGVRSGFTHVETEAEPKKITILLRIFKLPSAKRDAVVVHEVEPTWKSLDDGDVFVLEKDEKIWVWQGKDCSPMEKAKAAQVVNDMTLAKHLDVEVISQTESRSRTIVGLLGGDEVEQTNFKARCPVESSRTANDQPQRPRRLFRLSDASGQLSLDIVKDGEPTKRTDLQGEDVFLLDTGSHIWVWQGAGASKGEKAMWIKVAQMYKRRFADTEQNIGAHASPVSKVVEGYETPAFLRAIEV